MSTKIYNGYISKLGIEPLLKQFASRVKDFEEMKKVLYYKSLASEATFKIDAEKNCDQHQKLIVAHDKNIEGINRAIIKYTLEDNDLSARCCVIPVNKNKTLILFYCQEKGLTDLWESMPNISEYHYQNSTDKPDYISSIEWNQRRRDWDKALDHKAPVKVGYSFEFTDERLPFPRREECLKHIPSIKERALNVAYDTFIIKETKKHKSKNVEIGDMMSIFNNVRDNWFKFKKTSAFKKSMVSAQKNLIKITFQPKNIRKPKSPKTSTKK